MGRGSDWSADAGNCWLVADARTAIEELPYFERSVRSCRSWSCLQQERNSATSRAAGIRYWQS